MNHQIIEDDNLEPPFFYQFAMNVGGLIEKATRWNVKRTRMAYHQKYWKGKLITTNHTKEITASNLRKNKEQKDW